MYITKKASDNNVYFHFALKKSMGQRNCSMDDGACCLSLGPSRRLPTPRSCLLCVSNKINV